jgi:hypothetical protein
VTRFRLGDRAIDIVVPHSFTTTREVVFDAHVDPFAGAPDAVVLKSIHIDHVRERVRLTDRSVFLTAGDRDNSLRAGMRAGCIDAMQRLTTTLSAQGY